jgi:opine dehydrogenase
VSDTSSLKRVFNTNLGYSRVPFPMLPIEGTNGEKVTLNLGARFFWEDVPFGLVILKDIAQLVDVKTPHMDKQIIFHQKFMPVKYVCDKTGAFLDNQAMKETGAPRSYGIKTADELVSMSLTTDNKTYPLFRAKM